ncbi:MAG: HesA/MoeB/ThiF family protein [Methylococcales bacterium]
MKLPRIRFRYRDDPYRNRWSRTIGGLGDQTVWDRLIRLRIGIIGCGRSGSLVAGMLARSGVRTLSLIDPDILEAHNLGEMDCILDTDLDRSKADSIADTLKISLSGTEIRIEPVIAGIEAPVAWQALKNCDVLFSCVDNDAARLRATFLASQYHKVLIDIGTGVFFSDDDLAQPRRTMGADVRLIFPGSSCLVCYGSVSHYAEAIATLASARDNQVEHWQNRRAGSLRSMNQIAAGIAVQLLQDLVAERIHDSTWVHIEFGSDGRINVTYPEPSRNTRCSVCAHSGQGDLEIVWDD